MSMSPYATERSGWEAHGKRWPFFAAADRARSLSDGTLLLRPGGRGFRKGKSPPRTLSDPFSKFWNEIQKIFLVRLDTTQQRHLLLRLDDKGPLRNRIVGSARLASRRMPRIAPRTARKGTKMIALTIRKKIAR